MLVSDGLRSDTEPTLQKEVDGRCVDTSRDCSPQGGSSYSLIVVHNTKRLSEAVSAIYIGTRRLQFEVCLGQFRRRFVMRLLVLSAPDEVCVPQKREPIHGNNTILERSEVEVEEGDGNPVGTAHCPDRKRIVDDLALDLL